jgi:hypothetical protein
MMHFLNLIAARSSYIPESNGVRCYRPSNIVMSVQSYPAYSFPAVLIGGMKLTIQATEFAGTMKLIELTEFDETINVMIVVPLVAIPSISNGKSQPRRSGLRNHHLSICATNFVVSPWDFVKRLPAGQNSCSSTPSAPTARSRHSKRASRATEAKSDLANPQILCVGLRVSGPRESGRRNRTADTTGNGLPGKVDPASEELIEQWTLQICKYGMGISLSCKSEFPPWFST